MGGPLRVLILGGTGEALGLARRVADSEKFDAVMSLAGVTSQPSLPPLRLRRGGFGGVAGLVDYLQAEVVHVLVLATHPFAAQMRSHAIQASRLTQVPLLILERAPWVAQPGDVWNEVPDMPTAALALGQTPRRVLLTIGRKDLHCFSGQPQHHYIVRSIEAIDSRPFPHITHISDRGPFDEPSERALLLERRIDILVSKNSGGGATQPKLAAARALNVPVIMVARPPQPDLDGAEATVAFTLAQAFDTLNRLHALLTERGV